MVGQVSQLERQSIEPRALHVEGALSIRARTRWGSRGSVVAPNNAPSSVATLAASLRAASWYQRTVAAGTKGPMTDAFARQHMTLGERQWSHVASASFWTAVILRAPHSLTQALEEATTGAGTGWPRVQAIQEAFFGCCQTLPWRFFANLYDAFVGHGRPECVPWRGKAAWCGKELTTTEM
jgi:hypothetical protein